MARLLSAKIKRMPYVIQSTLLVLKPKLKAKFCRLLDIPCTHSVASASDHDEQ